GLPPEEGASAADIGPADLGVVRGKGPELDLGAAAGERDDAMCELEDGELVGVPDVDGVRLVRVEQAVDALDLVVDVAERAGLRPIAIDGEGFAAQRLHDEIGDD